MASLEELRERLEKAGEIEDTLDRRILALAVISECLAPKGIRPVLVGGAAVEFYTFGHYTTYDIDLAMPSVQAVDTVMDALGFEKSGRYWVREDLELVVEAPASRIAGDANRIIVLDVEGMSAYVIGVEDLIIDRLNACVHWKSREDGRWAKRLLAIHSDSLDWDYLLSVAEQHKVQEALAALRRELTSENGEN